MLQSLKTDLKHKFELEELKVDATLDDIAARKKQLLSQMKERYQNKLQSQLQTMRLQFDKERTQCQIDHERRLQAMRNEVRARLESTHIQEEN